MVRRLLPFLMAIVACLMLSGLALAQDNQPQGSQNLNNLTQDSLGQGGLLGGQVLGAPPASVPPVAPPNVIPSDNPPNTFIPVVLAMDETAASVGLFATSFVSDLDAQFLSQWGFRPNVPVTVYLFSSGSSLAANFGILSNTDLTSSQLELISTQRRSYVIGDVRTGGLGILVNLGPGMGTTTYQDEVRGAITHDYALVMEVVRAGTAGPEWYREGLAWLIAYNTIPGDPTLSQRVFTTAVYNEQGLLPSLVQLTDNNVWNQLAGLSSPNRAAVVGLSYLSFSLMSPIGGQQLLSVLERTAAGENFESALQSGTGFTIPRLSNETTIRIPNSAAVQVLVPVELVPGQAAPSAGLPALVPSLQEPVPPIPPQSLAQPQP